MFFLRHVHQVHKFLRCFVSDKFLWHTSILVMFLDALVHKCELLSITNFIVMKQQLLGENFVNIRRFM